MFTIKKYSENYQEQYCNLYIETWKGEPYGELFEKENIIKSLVKNQDYLYLLFEEENKLIGFVGGRSILNECSFFENETNLDINTTFYISELAIDEKHKNLGWGQVLTLYLMGCARENSFKHFVLRTHSEESNPATALYEKLGFTAMKDESGNFYGAEVSQKRIDDRSEEDFRIYYYKTFGSN